MSICMPDSTTNSEQWYASTKNDSAGSIFGHLSHHQLDSQQTLQLTFWSYRPPPRYCLCCCHCSIRHLHRVRQQLPQSHQLAFYSGLRGQQLEAFPITSVEPSIIQDANFGGEGTPSLPDAAAALPDFVSAPNTIKNMWNIEALLVGVYS